MLLGILQKVEAPYCVIGGLAVNAYAEPVVSLDLDMVVVSGSLEKVMQAAVSDGFKVEQFEHSVNLGLPGSDLRIQLQTDKRYQPFIAGASRCKVLGYEMMVARVEDVLQGKLWAYADDTRRPSKRQKDLADIMRLVETRPDLKKLLPLGITDFPA
jgi:hypothetical protein